MSRTLRMASRCWAWEGVRGPEVGGHKMEARVGGGHKAWKGPLASAHPSHRLVASAGLGLLPRRLDSGRRCQEVVPGVWPDP